MNWPDASVGAEPTGPIEDERPALIALLGPTATGKTEIGLRIAEQLGGEIISVDSRQAYRGMEIGTAAPSTGQLKRVRHHGVGFLEPGERYGAGRFARLARGWIEDIEARERIPLLVGGTGFFYRALVRPIFREPALDAERRSRLGAWLAAADQERLAGWVRALDPTLADRLPVLDPQRVQRALEVALLTGRPLTWWQTHGTPEAAPIPARAFVLELDAERHRERIGARAERMLDGGWANEVRALHAAGHGPESPALKALGYSAVAEWLDGRISRATALACILRDTWGYARRQRTWLRHQLPADTVRLDASEPADRLAERVIEMACGLSGSGGKNTERER
jgi:tRNA dimethylallyltransferase